MIKPDCFAFAKEHKTKGCRALNDQLCLKGDCPFYKIQRQLDEENERLKNGLNKR